MNDEVAEKRAALRAALQWLDVRIVEDGFMIVVTPSQMNSVVGFRSTHDCLFVDNDLLKDTPFCVRSITAEGVFEYWSMNGYLHRLNDQPAFIMYDKRNGNYERGWYNNGVRHRIGAPAKIVGRGMRIDKINDQQDIETTTTVEFNWYETGSPPQAPRSPSYAALENVETHYRNGARHRDGGPAYSIGTAKIDWNHTTPHQRPHDGIWPYKAILSGYGEMYSVGQKINAMALDLTIEWRVNGGRLESQDFTDYVQANMFNDLNLFGGPFWKDDATRLTATSEYERICAEPPDDPT